jgi:hypothetical protein
MARWILDEEGRRNFKDHVSSMKLYAAAVHCMREALMQMNCLLLGQQMSGKSWGVLDLKNSLVPGTSITTAGWSDKAEMTSDRRQINYKVFFPYEFANKNRMFAGGACGRVATNSCGCTRRHQQEPQRS